MKGPAFPLNFSTDDAEKTLRVFIFKWPLVCDQLGEGFFQGSGSVTWSTLDGLMRGKAHV